MSRNTSPRSQNPHRTEPDRSAPVSRESSATRNTTSSTLSYFAESSSPYISPYSPRTSAESRPATTVSNPQPTRTFDLDLLRSEAAAYRSGTTSAAMSTYSSSSQESVYSNPGPQQYRVVTPGMINNPQNLSSVSLSQACPLVRCLSFAFDKSLAVCGQCVV